MSLRAKIEAVVYAADEPVTLAQLAAVFAPEVREIWAGEQAAAAADNEPDEAIVTDEATVTGDMATPSTHQTPAETAPETTTEVSPDGQTGVESDPETAVKRAARNEERAIREHLRAVLDALMAELDSSDRGVEIREVAGGYRMATKPEYHDAIRSFVKGLKPPMKLSLQALETLAVIAYKQPVTGPEISEIRGVESAGVLGSLISRKLITTAGRKPVIGRPILYKTTKEFLLRFGLKDVNELPSIEEFEKMAGELEENEAEAATDHQTHSMTDADKAMSEPAEISSNGFHPEGDADNTAISALEESSQTAAPANPGEDGES